MSADNLILITKKGRKYTVREVFIEGQVITEIAQTTSLRKAIKEANDYMTTTTIEYGLEIRI
ncbi:hypothetical protein LCGC14_1745230 [marine sediment metagenome]|uniref:Uncharacterized protein n=1 Tax=marine sediment metagenome TaxID=412755 RepID=A0A0F9H5G9_9ZZZZ